jgi:AcrR family transcriptional regulator
LLDPYRSSTIVEMTESKEPNKHQLRSEATRKALLDAAEAVFSRDGYERAQIDEIAKESGRTRGAVYAQFKTKEQLFIALQERRVRTSKAHVEALLAHFADDNYDKKLAVVRKYYSDLNDISGGLLDVELKLYAVRHPESGKEWHDRYVRLFAAESFSRVFGIQDEPGRSKVDSRNTALSAIKGALILAMLFMPEQLTPDEVSSLLGEIFDSLFSRKQEPPVAKAAGRLGKRT